MHEHDLIFRVPPVLSALDAPLERVGLRLCTGCVTVSPGLRESRTQEGTHRFYRFRTPLRGRTHRFYFVAPTFLLAPFLLGGTAFFKFLIKIK